MPPGMLKKVKKEHRCGGESDAQSTSTSTSTSAASCIPLVLVLQPMHLLYVWRTVFVLKLLGRFSSLAFEINWQVVVGIR